jgi:hypothetical protein
VLKIGEFSSLAQISIRTLPRQVLATIDQADILGSCETASCSLLRAQIAACG